MATYTLGVIGAGNMAEAILRGVVGNDVVPPEEIVAAEPMPTRREELSRELGIACTDDNAVAAGCPYLLLAVKPQVMPAVLAEIAGHVRPEAVVISIAAGVSTCKIDRALGGCGKIVRVMPNTPMLVGAGVSALSAGPRTDTRDMEWARRLFGACGRTVLVDEEKMDAVTAVSGSGPAYLFYLVEAMIAAGVAEGLGPETASLLAIETCLGAAKLLLQTREAPQVLRARVTSPRGTTQAAIESLDAAGVKASLISAIRAAAERSRELGR